MKLSALFPCCIARHIDLICNRFCRKNTILFYIIVGCVILFIGLLCTITKGILLGAGLICSDESISDNLKNMCNMVKQEEQFQEEALILPQSINLCTELCQTEPGRISCQTKHLSKATVFVLKLLHSLDNDNTEASTAGSLQVVVKSLTEQHVEEMTDKTDESYWKHQSSHLPSQDEFVNMVRSLVGLSATAPESNSGLQLLIRSASQLYQRHAQKHEAHHKFWRFVEDQEFLMSLLLADTQLFPKLLGTCGGFYAVEYVETLQENIFIPTDLNRNERLLKAIDIVNYVEKLDSTWHEPVHLCDVKMRHFGWSQSGQVKFVDVDSVMTQNLLADTISNVPHCETDEDCSFFDCSSKCDVKSAKCLPQRTNTNLQVVCSRVFLGEGSAAVRVLGLLLGEEQEEEEGRGGVWEAVQLCRTNPGMTAPVLLHALQREYEAQPQ